jgi:tetratricopeptide (TPR) repeat protein
MTNTPGPTNTPLPAKKRRLFLIVTIFLPLILFLFVETGLRLGGYGADLDLVVTSIHNGTEVYTVNPAAGKRYFDPSRYFVPQISSGYFEKEKGPNTLRIFILGESTSAGFPYQYNAVPSRMLQVQLELLYPEKKIEVVNASLTGTNSFTVLDFIAELSPFQPDLFIIYSGQNEFYGALGAASTNTFGTSRWIIRSYQLLRSIKTFLLLERSITAAARLFSAETSAPFNGTLMQQLAKDKAIGYGTPLYDHAVAAFERNLYDAVQLASGRNIPVVLSTLVTNERSLPPFVSIRSGTMSRDQQRMVDSLVAAGEQELRAGSAMTALSYFRRVVSLDSMWAMGQYRLGQCYDAVRKPDSARIAYGKARDYDGLRFRASAEANSRIRNIAVRSGAVIADVESTFRASSLNGILGSELLWEHVHPTFNGYVLLSKSWRNAVMQCAPFSRNAPADPERIVNDSAMAERLRITPLDLEIGEMTMRSLMHRWPFTDDASSGLTAANELQAAAIPFMQGTYRWNEAHYALADAYAKKGMLRAAVMELEAVAAYMPQEPYPFIRSGELYALLQNDDRATMMYGKALQLKENLSVRVQLGIVLLKLGQYEAAMEQLNSAITANATSADRLTERDLRDAQFFFAAAMVGAGKIEDAGMLVTILLRQYPDDPRLPRLMGEIEQQARHIRQ